MQRQIKKKILTLCKKTSKVKIVKVKKIIEKANINRKKFLKLKNTQK